MIILNAEEDKKVPAMEDLKIFLHMKKKTNKRPVQHGKMRFRSLPKRSITNCSRLCQRKPDKNAI
mgnify:CR=1 FL=1